MLKFPTEEGIVTIRSSLLIPAECASVGTSPVTPGEKKAHPANLTVPLHPNFLDQDVVVGGSLSDEGRTELCSLLKRNLDIFAWQPFDMTGVPRSVAEHRLNIREGCPPVRQKKRGQALERTKAIQAKVEKLVEARIMREVYYHDWLSNPVMVKKHDGSWRMCVDFTDLNKACPQDCYPLSEIDWKVESLSADEEKTAFHTGLGVYCYTKMPFGLKNAGATYQRLMEKAFENQMGRNIEVYMDDLVVKSHTEVEMVRDIEETFQTLRKINMKLNPKKCSFGLAEGLFLGYVITPEGIKPCPDKTTAVLQLPSPQTIKEVQSLNGKLASLNRTSVETAETTFVSSPSVGRTKTTGRADHVFVCYAWSHQCSPDDRTGDGADASLLYKPCVTGSGTKLLPDGKAGVITGLCSKKASKIFSGTPYRGNHRPAHQTGHVSSRRGRTTAKMEHYVGRAQHHIQTENIKLLVTIGDATHSTKAWMNFMIVKSMSPYNGIIGRPGLKAIQAVPSTIHGMLKFPTEEGIVTIRSSLLIPAECASVGTSPVTPGEKKAHPANLTVPLHPNFLDQEVVVGGSLSDEGRTELCSLLKRNLVIFAWQPSDMTGVPQSVAEHRLNVREGCPPVRQKKRGQALERTKAIQAKVEKLVEARIMREVYYHDWLSNPVMTLKKCIKKSDFRWTTEAEQAFQQLKQHLSALPLLAAPKPREELIIPDDRTGDGADVSLLYKPCVTGSGTKLLPDGKAGFITGLCSKKASKIFSGTSYHDFLNEMPSNASQGASVAETQEEPWTLFTDGSSCVDGSGAWLILTNPDKVEFTYALRFQFAASNNKADYEALIAGLRIATQMGVKNIQANVDSKLLANQVLGTYIAKEDNMIKYLDIAKDLVSGFKTFSICQVSWSKNKKANALSKIESTSFAHLSKQVLVEVLENKSINRGRRPNVDDGISELPERRHPP
nr:reverse transcriptase domain-containing protein [Tanacetum cinerariifolium]